MTQARDSFAARGETLKELVHFLVERNAKLRSFKARRLCVNIALRCKAMEFA